MESGTLNIYSKSDDLRGRILSNFSHHPFVLDGKHFESVEGFIQGIAFPESDTRREATFRAWGSAAKKLEEGQKKDFVWWQNQKFKFGSQEEHGLIERALRAKFEQNSEAKDALIATGDLLLTHILLEPESGNTCLPAKKFCRMLMNIRKSYLSTQLPIHYDMRILEQRTGKMEERNKMVEADKAWETSWTRRVLLMAFTYLAMGVYMWAVDIARPWLNAVVPAIAFMLTTLTMPLFKKIWLKRGRRHDHS